MAKGLLYRVECKSLYPFYELIAAFDIQQAAENYAVSCATANPVYEYRVIKGRRVLRDANSCRPTNTTKQMVAEFTRVCG